LAIVSTARHHAGPARFSPLDSDIAHHICQLHPHPVAGPFHLGAIVAPHLCGPH